MYLYCEMPKTHISGVCLANPEEVEDCLVRETSDVKPPSILVHVFIYAKKKLISIFNQSNILVVMMTITFGNLENITGMVCQTTLPRLARIGVSTWIQLTSILVCNTAANVGVGLQSLMLPRSDPD